jgi:hypothetical protein
MFPKLTTVALCFAVLCPARPAAADPDVPLRAIGKGQVVFQQDPSPDAPGVQVYHTDGVSTLAGRVTGSGITFFSLDGGVEGTFGAESADGSTVEASYHGTWAPVPGEFHFRFDVETVWRDGTGRFAGITGESYGSAILDGLTGAFDWKHEGVWLLP